MAKYKKKNGVNALREAISQDSKKAEYNEAIKNGKAKVLIFDLK